MKTKSLLITIAILIFTMSSVAQETGSFTDSRDGKIYKTVKIGSQTWMAENLAYKANSALWAYHYDSNYIKTYGCLYNWKIAKNSCPSGWHLPSDSEWTVLTTYLGGENLAGGKMKEAGTIHWVSPNTNANNSSGFTALPGGYIIHNSLEYFGNYCYWWSSNVDTELDYAWCLSINNNNEIDNGTSSKEFGYSVRCAKDK